jgi:hypothetical protein
MVTSKVIFSNKTKINTMKRFLLFSILPLLVIQFSCKKETIIKEIPITHSWSLDSNFVGIDKIMLTSVPMNDSMIAVASNYQIAYVNVKHLGYTVRIGIPDKSYYSALVPPSISKGMTVSVSDPNKLVVFATYMPVFQSGIPESFKPTYSSSTTSIKSLPTGYIFNSGISIINDKYILAPFETDWTNSKATFSLIKVSQKGWNTIIESTKNITAEAVPSTHFYSGNDYSATFFGKFFYTYYRQFFRVDTLGNVKSFGYSPIQTTLSDNVSQMFTLNNYLFAMAGGNFFVSNDQGENWSLFYQYVSGDIYSWCNFWNVGKDVYASYLSQIWKVTLSGESLKYKEIDNDGLQGSQITSINKCGKYAFVTTLSGLYYRDTTKFNTFK